MWGLKQGQSRQQTCLNFIDKIIPWTVTFRARRMGANPEKSDLLDFRGPAWRKSSELCVLIFFLGKTDKMLPKSRFSKPIFGHPAGSTKLDRPYCKLFWDLPNRQKTLQGSAWCRKISCFYVRFVSSIKTKEHLSRSVSGLATHMLLAADTRKWTSDLSKKQMML